MPPRLPAYTFGLVCALCSVSGAMQTAQLESPGGLAQAMAINPNAKRYPVTGFVFNSATNQPIRRALVRVNSGGEQYLAFTGADGTFRLSNVPEGQAFLSAEHPGYFDPQSVAGPMQRAISLHQIGAGSNEFRLPLIPAAKLIGTIRDADGEPVESVQLQVIGQQIVEGRKQWVNRGGASTDDDGVYQVEQLTPGPVVVCTTDLPLYGFPANGGEVYPARCYPDSTEFASAQQIDIAPGQEARADFTLRLVPGFTVSGSIVGPPSSAPVGIWREGPGGQINSVRQFGGQRRDGQFVLASVPNGTWRVHFQSRGTDGKTFDAVQEISVNGANVQNIQVVLAPAADIPIQIEGPSAPVSEVAAGAPPPQPRSSVQVRLLRSGIEGGKTQYWSSQLPTQLPNDNGAPDVQPSLAILDVQPGQYEVRASSSGGGCIESISYAGADLSREPLVIAPGSAPAPMAVNLRNDCASLNVNANAISPNSSGSIVLASDNALFEPQVTQVQTGAQPVTVSFANLTPGTYHVYAVADLDGLEYANAQAMRGIPSESVTLGGNQNATITISIPDRGKP